MVSTPQRGAIADLSATGKHTASPLTVFQRGMHKKLFEERIERAGDVVGAAKWYYYATISPGNRDVIDTMVFFGDPALKLRYPESALSVELDYFIGTADYPDHILLEWQSVSETDNGGYRLFRGVTSDPDQASLLVPFIPPINPGGSGAYYSYQDSDNLTPGVVYYYWIEHLEGAIWNQHRDDPQLNPVVPWGCSRYDVVCNFVIDLQDITAIANHWDCAQGSSCYDDYDYLDVNDDFVIDVQDVMLSASRWGCQFGQTCYP